MKSAIKKWLIFFLKIGVSALLLYWFISKSDFTQIFKSLQSIPVSILIMAMLINLSLMCLTAYKWRLFLPRIPYLKILKVTIIGVYYSLVLPGQLAGEAAKAYVLGKGSNESEQIAASVIIDKILGMLGLTLIGVIGLFFASIQVPKSILLSLLLTIVVAVVALMAIRIKHTHVYIHRILNIFNRYKKLEPIVVKIKQLIEEWYQYSRNVYVLIYNVIISMIFQVACNLMISLILFGLKEHVSVFDMFWINAVLSVVLLLPITIAGIGLREGSLIGMLGLLHVPQEKALALSFVMLGLQVFVGIFGGLSEFKRQYGNRIQMILHKKKPE